MVDRSQRPSVEAVDCRYPLDGIDGLHLPRFGALLDRQFGHFVAARRRGRDNFRYRIRGATRALLMQFSWLADDEDVAHAMIGALALSGCPQSAPAAGKINA